MQTLSIIVPTYNDRRIRTALASIHALKARTTLAQVNAIVVNGSTDEGYQAFVEDCLLPDDILVSEPDEGIFDALNKGLDLATSGLIGWIGADDRYAPSLSGDQLVRCFMEREVDAVIAATELYKGELCTRRINPVLSVRPGYQRGYHIPHFSSFWSRDFLGQERFSLGFRVASDIEYFYRQIVLRAARCHVLEALATQMDGGGNSNGSWKNVLRANAEVFSIYARHQGVTSALSAVTRKLSWKLGQFDAAQR